MRAFPFFFFSVVCSFIGLNAVYTLYEYVGSYFFLRFYYLLEQAQ